MTRIRFLSLCLACLGALVPAASAWAFGSAQGTVYRLHVRASDGLVYVYLNGNRINRSGTCTRHVDGEDIKEVALEE
jgi:hypothetical protein